MKKLFVLLLWVILSCTFVLAQNADQEEQLNDCICTMQFDPVCWVNGQTYGNACTAGCEQVEVDYKGECEPVAVTAVNYQILTPAHEKLIEEIVGEWSVSASVQMKETVKNKVAAKIDEINYTLSVSSFIQWSPVLKRFQFVLEILSKVDSLV